MRRVQELELDHVFWNTISTDAEFREWFLGRTKFAGKSLELVTDEKWHQRWYRDPEAKAESETDILLIFRNATDGNRYAVHIENKPDHGLWRVGQAEQYKRRACHQMQSWKYVDFQTALIASQSFIRRHPIEIAHFDIVIRYEQLRRFIPGFGQLEGSL